MFCLWRYLFVGIALVTWPKTWPVGIDPCNVGYCFHGNLAKYAADLCHYLDTNLRVEKCVPVINIGLKTSRLVSTLVLEGRHQMRTRDLRYCKELGTCVGFLCMLISKYSLSSRDYFVVLGVITGTELSTQLY